MPKFVEPLKARLIGNAFGRSRALYVHIGNVYAHFLCYTQFVNYQLVYVRTLNT